MPYEGCEPEAPPRPLEMVDARLGRGTHTDDTEMPIALAESLIARGRVDQSTWRAPSSRSTTPAVDTVPRE